MRLPVELWSCASVARVLVRSRRSRTGLGGTKLLAQQAVLVPIGDPLAVLLIRLAPGHNLHFWRVRQQQIESLCLQNIPHRLPVHTARLHRHMFYPADFQPGGPCQQVRRHRPQAPGFLFGLAIPGNHYAYAILTLWMSNPQQRSYTIRMVSPFDFEPCLRRTPEELSLPRALLCLAAEGNNS